MTFPHFLMTLLVVVIWGLNFMFVKLGLEEISPLLLCALRFFLASIPAVFFIKIPAESFKTIALYGLVMFALQFALIFIGMQRGMTAGMASLIMQVQVFFSIFFAVWFNGEELKLGQILGASVAFIGIALVGMHFDTQVSLLGYILVLSAAAAWGVGNLLSKKIKSKNYMAAVIWGSFVAFWPMFVLSLIFEGPHQIIESYHRLSFRGLGSLMYIVFISTWIGYGLWNRLLSLYSVGTVVPFTLLIPVVGILSSVIFLGEPFQSWKLLACLLVITGLCINILTPYLSLKFNLIKINRSKNL